MAQENTKPDDGLNDVLMNVRKVQALKVCEMAEEAFRKSMRIADELERRGQVAEAVELRDQIIEIGKLVATAFFGKSEDQRDQALSKLQRIERSASPDPAPRI
jgi:hypothetical protein